MAYILDKETFKKKDIIIERPNEKGNSYGDIIKYIKETSVIENFREYFIYYYNLYIIISDNYVLYSCGYNPKHFLYTSIDSEIISIIDNNITKTLLIQTEKYIKIFRCSVNYILKHRILIDSSEIGKVVELFKYILEDGQSYKSIVVKTTTGIFYIEKNSLKRKAQAVILPEAIKFLRYIYESSDTFIITYKSEDKIIGTKYNRYIYDKDIGSKIFNINIAEEAEKILDTQIYKNIEEKIIENCRELKNYKNYISSEVITLNNDGDVMLILENETNKAIVFWENNYEVRNIVEIPKETKLNISQNFKSILIYYFSDNNTHIIICEKEREKYKAEYVKSLQVEIRKVEGNDITGILYHNRVNSNAIFSTSENSFAKISYADRHNRKNYYVSKYKNDTCKIYFCDETNDGIRVVFQTKNYQGNVYQLNNDGKFSEITLDFEMSENNIKSLNEHSCLSIIEINQIILSDDMEDFDF